MADPMLQDYLEHTKALNPRPVLYVVIEQAIWAGYDGVSPFTAPEDIKIDINSLKAMRRWRAFGGSIIGLSNQGAVALNLLSMLECAQMLQQTFYLCAGVFDFISICIHHPDAHDPIMAQCWCRLPRIGQIVQSALSLSERYGVKCPPHLGLFVSDQVFSRAANDAGLRFMATEEWRRRWPTPIDIYSPRRDKEMK